MRTLSAVALLAACVFLACHFRAGNYSRPRLWNPAEAEPSGWRARAVAGNIVGAARP